MDLHKLKIVLPVYNNILTVVCTLVFLRKCTKMNWNTVHIKFYL